MSKNNRFDDYNDNDYARDRKESHRRQGKASRDSKRNYEFD